MNKSDFHYDLPEELIAQTPLSSRDNSRLLCMNKITNVSDTSPPAITHRMFKELPEILHPGDCLVLNDSRVLPARLIGTREPSGGSGTVEVLLLNQTGQTWECLVRPGKKIKTGAKLTFGSGELTATVTAVLDNGNRRIEFHSSGNFFEVLQRLGKMPLPPYIHQQLQDAERYQTVYSKTPGSAAAPTAGLHFTRELLGKLNGNGIQTCYITLHVGIGTFRPVKTDKIEDHIMHEEAFTIPEQTAEIINNTKKNGGRVIAVGTTSCRTLETVCTAEPCSKENTKIPAVSGTTGIFIYPGYKFRCIDGLITNFHLPESTLIMLVSALAGREQTLAAYHEAIRERYRFYSFGDAMLIL